MNIMEKAEIEKIIIELLSDENGELYKTLKKMLTENRTSIEEPLRREEDEELRAEIAEMLRNCGIRTNIRGYRYLQETVMLYIRYPYTNKFTQIYAEVAIRNRTTTERVVRAIRYAIDIAWKKTDKTMKPTTSQFISIIAEYIQA